MYSAAFAWEQFKLVPMKFIRKHFLKLLPHIPGAYELNNWHPIMPREFSSDLRIFSVINATYELWGIGVIQCAKYSLEQWQEYSFTFLCWWICTYSRDKYEGNPLASSMGRHVYVPRWCTRYFYIFISSTDRCQAIIKTNMLLNWWWSSFKICDHI